jgi:thiol:disulfide interchange protein
MTYDRFFVAFLMLAGALWLRQRARKLPPGKRMKALYALILFFIPALIVTRWGTDRLPFGAYERLAVEIAALAVLFTVMALVFVRPQGKEDNGHKELMEHKE